MEWLKLDCMHKKGLIIVFIFLLIANKKGPKRFFISF
jgi:hypothetical protein